MSYILDALKKAESERTLGSVPDIHAQPAPLAALDGKPALWRRPLAWALAALIVALAALAWFGPWRMTAAPAPASASQPVVQSAAAAPPAVVVPAPVASQPPVIAPPAVIATAPAAALSIAAPPAPKAEAAKPKAAAKPPAREKRPEAIAGAPALPPAAPAAEAQLPLLRDLPANIQREIPALAVGGYIYAGKAAERSVLINNRLLREGEQIAPGLTLEKMLPREAVLNYRGYRYRLPY